MTWYYVIGLIIAAYYLIVTIRKSIEYKKKNPTDSITLSKDNSFIRKLCGILLILMVVLSGFSFGAMYRHGQLLSNQSIQLIFTLLFFIALYVPLSTKTKVSSVGIYRNTGIIEWDNVIKIDQPVTVDKGKVKVKVTYKTKHVNHNVIDLYFKSDVEYNQLVELVNKYSKYKIGAKKKLHKDERK